MGAFPITVGATFAALSPETIGVAAAVAALAVVAAALGAAVWRGRRRQAMERRLDAAERSATLTWLRERYPFPAQPRPMGPATTPDTRAPAPAREDELVVIDLSERVLELDADERRGRHFEPGRSDSTS
jgi:hypothetical protein